MNRRFVAVVTATLLLLATAVPASSAPGTSTGSKLFHRGGTYIVQLAEWPVVAYDGSIDGYRATKAAPGSKINPDSAAVTRYVGYLVSRHDALLASVGVGQAKKLYDYVYSYNGFAARLTATQANKLAITKGVLGVSPDKRFDVDTSSTPSFLGLDADGGLWDQLGGVGSAGEGIVIGVVDSGIWPESLSFSDRADANGIPSNSPSAKKVFQQLPGWHGKCLPGEQFIATNCNQKLIGARYYNAAWADVEAGLNGNQTINRDRPWEFTSPRDYNGHGTHTSSTAGGNHGVPATGPAAVFGAISGMAPRARVAMYKALWSTEDASTASGFTSDLTAAIDQAVADGVDVINYSISGTTTNFLDPAQVSFLFAAAAGVFVSASAGNSGPTTGTVAHPGPWLTTVAAGTHNRNGNGSVTLGNGATYFGASVATAVGPAPLIDSTAAGLSGADPTKVALCYAAIDNSGTPVLDPALVAGKIVVCDRGVTARVNKSLAVQEAGGIGMILVNTSPNSLNADFHFVPTVHLQNTDRAAVKAYAATAGATATINQATIVYNAPAPFTASFSSRGPLTAGGGDLLKPDVIAPGQDILAAVAPPGNAGRDFNLYSGTSMSAPHVAGLAALLTDLHPAWSPAAIKSSLMTSAYDVLDGPNTNPLVIFRQGAGHVQPNSAADPGLVYDAGLTDWRGFLRSQGLCTFCFGASPAPVFDTSDFNGASIAIGDLVYTQTVTRRVTNVGSSTATYTPSYTGMSGITTLVSPSSLELDPGETGTFTVQFTQVSATLNAYTGGQLTWTDGTHDVRIPMVVKPVPISAPATFTAAAGADSGSLTWNAKVGYSGALSANAYGLVADNVTADEIVSQDPDQDPATDSFTSGVNYYDFSLTNGTDQYWAGGTMAATTEAGSDLDVYLLRENANGTAGFQFPGDLVAQSADGDSEEIVELRNPATGNYRLMVHGWGTPDGASTYDLHWWLVNGAADGGSLVSNVHDAANDGDPAAVVIGDTYPIDSTYTGINMVGTQYRGIVTYFDGSAVIGRTLVILNR